MNDTAAHPDVTRLASHAAHAAELFRMLRKSPQHPAALASEFLHGKKSLDSDSRRAISALAFSALRCRLLVEQSSEYACTESGLTESARAHIGAALVVLPLAGISDAGALIEAVHAGADAAALHDVLARLLDTDGESAARFARAAHGAFERIDAAAQEAAREEAPDARHFAALSARWSVPAWVLERWIARSARSMPAHAATSRAVALAESLMHAAPLVIRVNTSRTNARDIAAALADAGVQARPCALAPAGFVLPGRDRITELPFFADGLAEVQDEASQLAALALAPAADWRILDACAGAGGKTMHIADLQADRGEIVAADVEAPRLRSLSARALRCGFRSIRTVTVRGDQGPDERPGSFDAVLVDAPCSATGTARRTPTVLHRLTPKALERFAARQSALLDLHARHVRPGGVLVYATCSLMSEENEQVAESFLARHPEFTGAPLAPAFASCGATVPGLMSGEWHLALSPAAHGTDGFFIARMRRLE